MGEIEGAWSLEEWRRLGAREQRESVSINFYECLDRGQKTFYPFF